MSNSTLVRWFKDLSVRDVPIVGGKNASLGEMTGVLAERGVRVPDGFATTADAYRLFLKHNALEAPIARLLAERTQGRETLEGTGRAIRALIRGANLPDEMVSAIRDAYQTLSLQHHVPALAVAVRSSATAEDLPEASFAGQQETFLNVSGEARLLEAVRSCFASLFTDRAIVYRENHGFDHLSIALSVGVQKMVRADLASSGVMFSIDTDTGFPRTVTIDAAWGLGESVVQGTVDPDEYRVFKPLLNRADLVPIVEKRLGRKQRKLVYTDALDASTVTLDTTPDERNRFVLTDDEILQLARWACAIEAHYQRPMDMEWAKDGETGELYVVQARPETVQARRKAGVLEEFSLRGRGAVLASGLAIGQRIATGPVCLIKSAADIDRFVPGSVLVTEMTDPDWVPIMRSAAAIVTDHGGRTSHAAIVSREMALTAVVGTATGTTQLHDGQIVTVSCAEGDTGRVYDGALPFDRLETDLTALGEPPVRIMLNIASPGAAFRWWQLPVRGIGLARMEFIISGMIKIHPMALVRFDQLTDPVVRADIEARTVGYADKTQYFVDHLSRGIAAIACAQYPEPVIVRLSDFKTNEYASLIGGAEFEPKEANPMLGFRGASRYYHEHYQPGFALECQALVRARETIGLDNIVVMVPFVRTPQEADRVLAVMAENGLRRGERGLKVYMMCEIPSNVILAEAFADRFDGFSIGSNDLTQLILGVDRDSAQLKALFDERDDAVKTAIRDVIARAHRKGIPVGICGQAPSDYPDFAEYLVECGIDSMSLNPDSVIPVVRRLAGMGKARVPAAREVY